MKIVKVIVSFLNKLGFVCKYSILKIITQSQCNYSILYIAQTFAGQRKHNTCHSLCLSYTFCLFLLSYPFSFFQSMPHLYVNAIRLCVFRSPLGLCAASHLFICVICERIIWALTLRRCTLWENIISLLYHSKLRMNQILIADKILKNHYIISKKTYIN